MNFLGFRFEFLRFYGFSAILIAIKMNIDRDLFEDLGDRDQGLVRIAILHKIFTL